MSEEWKKHDRPCPPCVNCGAELYERFWGNGGWAKADKATGKCHSERDCIVRLKAQLAVRPVTDADIDHALAVAKEWLECRGLTQTAPRHKIDSNPADYDMSDVQSLAWLLGITKAHGLAEVGLGHDVSGESTK